MPQIRTSFFLNPLLLTHAWLVLAALICSPVGGSQNKNIFILAGQSNMAGRGGVVNNTRTGVNTWDGVVPMECRPDPAILRLNAELQWVEAEEPLDQDIDVNKTCGIGPGMAFANRMLQMVPGVGVVGLVPCAIGGTNISQWARGGWLYRQMVERARAAAQDGGTIQAVLWCQGESDTVSKEDADKYKGRLEKFFGDLRDDLESPMLPIIQVAIASGEGPYTETVRQAQLGIDLLNIRIVDAKGLPLGPDNLHLTTSAQVQLGKMLAQAYLQFLPGPEPTDLAQGQNSLSNSDVLHLHRSIRFILFTSLSSLFYLVSKHATNSILMLL
ncbi:hypothetical protein Ancab_016445 [Ancistrocladus abbreviatus]